MKKALVLGVTGQDGSYLAEVLLGKDYEVHGMVRRSATGNTRNIEHLMRDPQVFQKRFFLHRGDLADPTSLYRIISTTKPQEIYNEADQDHVSWSYDMVGYSADITGAAVARILEIIKQINPKIRYFQPCTSNMFGMTDAEYQTEMTPFLYNHESPRRTEEYVTRKITKSVARIVCGKQDKLILGDLSAKIDWGYAREYMEAAWQILQLEKPDDFIIATGEAHSVKEFVDEAFLVAGLKSEKYVVIDQSLVRPTKTSALIGDITRAKQAFDFNPQYKFKELVKLMVETDIKAEKKASAFLPM